MEQKTRRTRDKGEEEKRTGDNETEGELYRLRNMSARCSADRPLGAFVSEGSVDLGLGAAVRLRGNPDRQTDGGQIHSELSNPSPLS